MKEKDRMDIFKLSFMSPFSSPNMLSPNMLRRSGQKRVVGPSVPAEELFVDVNGWEGSTVPLEEKIKEKVLAVPVYKLRYKHANIDTQPSKVASSLSHSS